MTIFIARQILPTDHNMSIKYTGIFILGHPPIHFSDSYKINDIVEAVAQYVDIHINQKRSFGASDKTLDHTIQIIVKNQVVYASACIGDLSHVVAFNYLNFVIEEITRSGFNIEEIGDKLSVCIRQLMNLAPTDYRFNPLLIINNKTQEITDIMSDNIQLAIRRGDKLSDLQYKAGKLLNVGSIFNKTTKELKCFLIQKNIKYIFVLMCVLTFIVLSLVLLSYYLLWMDDLPSLL